MISLVPLSKSLAAENGTFYETGTTYFQYHSTSKRVLEIIREQIAKDYNHFRNDLILVNSIVKRKDIYRDPDKFWIGKKSEKIYYINIPKDYMMYCRERETSKYLSTFDFSNNDLGDVSVLPDFSDFRPVKTLNFSNCGITTIDGLEELLNKNQLRCIDKLYLKGNIISLSRTEYNLLTNANGLTHRDDGNLIKTHATYMRTNVSIKY